MKKIIIILSAVALSLSVWAQQTVDTMFVHQRYATHEFAIKDVDSILFHRTAERSSAQSVLLNFNTAIVQVGQTLSLTATVLPPEAVNRSVAWISNNAAVATVDNNGVITGVGVGTATITAITFDGHHTATNVVTTVATMINVTGMTLSQTTADITTGGEVTLTANITPGNATNTIVHWGSSNPLVASVVDGVVTGLTPGAVTITATTQDGNFTATCVVTVTPVPVTGVTLDYNEISIKINRTHTLIATVLPAGTATNTNVTWTSSAPGVATVDNNGLISPVSVGTTNITVTTEEGNFSATSLVTILPTVNYQNIATYEQEAGARSREAFIYGGRFDITLMSPRLDEWRQSYALLFPTFQGYHIQNPRGAFQLSFVAEYRTPAGGTGLWFMGPPSGEWQAVFPMEGPNDNPHTDVTFIISRNSTQTSDNVPAGYRAGGAVSFQTFLQQPTGFTIIQLEDTFWFRCRLEPNDWFVAVRQTAVPVPVEGVTIFTASDSMNAGGTLPLLAVINPINAQNRFVSWTSSNNSIATVQHGIITAHGSGDVVITVTTEEGGFTANQTVRIAPSLVSGVELNQNFALMEVGDKVTLTANVLPVYAENRNVTWLSRNPSIAAVDQNGEVTAMALGYTYIVATTQVGEFKDSARVTILDEVIAVTSIELDSRVVRIALDTTAPQLVATLMPVDASEKTVLWNSSNPAVATVNADGLVTPVSHGVALIIATSRSGGLRDTAIVMVQDPTINTVAAWLNGTPYVPNATYDITLLSPRLEAWRARQFDEFPEFAGFDIRMPRGTSATISLTAIYVNPAGLQFRGSATATAPGVIPMEAPGGNPLTDITFDIARSTTSGTPPVGQHAAATDTTLATGARLFMDFVDNTAFTIIEDCQVGVQHRFWLSSKADPEDWFLTVRPWIPIASISLNTTSHQLPAGAEFDLVATMLPANASGRRLTWATSNPLVATVDANGIVTAVDEGTAIITATTVCGNSVTCEIEVVVPEPAESVSLNQTTTTFTTFGQTLQLIATVHPANAFQGVTWTSSNPNVAWIDNDGLVTVLAAGTTTITVTTVDGGFTAQCAVTATATMGSPTAANIATFLQPYDATPLNAFLGTQAAPLAYDITLMSSKLEALRQTFIEVSTPIKPGFRAFTIGAPFTGTNRFSLLQMFDNGDGERRSSGTNLPGIHLMTGPGNNSNSDVFIDLLGSRNGVAGGVGSALQGAASWISLQRHVDATTGHTIIQDPANPGTFWFRSKADPNDWFVAVRTP